MNEDKLNSFAVSMAKKIIQARPNIPLTTALGVINFKMASLCGQLKIQLDTRSGFGSTPANMYQLLLIESGSGKGASQGLADNFFFKDAWTYIDKTVYPKFRAKALEQLQTEESERVLHNWVKEVGSVTESGLLAYAESYSIIGVGGLNLSIDEIGNSVISKADVFELLLQPYDSGLYNPKAKRSDSEAMTINNMNTCLFAFGNKDRLFDGGATETAFLKLMEEGYARRMVIIDDESIPSKRSPEDIVNEMKISEQIVEDSKGIREDIKSLVTKANLGKTLRLSDDAMYQWAVIKSEGDNYIVDNKGLEQAVKSDMAERVFKTAKLAAIYAFFEGKDEVSGRHMEEAFEVIKQSSKALAGLVKIQPVQERLLEQMLKEEKPITSNTMLGYKFINSNWSRKIQEYIDLAKELSSERDYVWKETNNKGVSYYLVHEKTQEEADEFEEVQKKERSIAEQLALLD